MIDPTTLTPISCATCEHFDGVMGCAAFPDGIPTEILTGRFDHREPFPNPESPTDNGVRYKVNLKLLDKKQIAKLKGQNSLTKLLVGR